MSPSRPASLEAALHRLAGALDQLEAATVRFRRARDQRQDLEDTLALMDDERQRLARERDAALHRSLSLERAAADVAARLGRAGGALRRLLAAAEQES